MKLCALMILVSLSVDRCCLIVLYLIIGILLLRLIPLDSQEEVQLREEEGLLKIGLRG